ncbi:MAG: hypothetical protein HQM06_01875 [Magnetococcales bacterium]|nr:hypothetical protein [Magnetococcales bacterium]
MPNNFLASLLLLSLAMLSGCTGRAVGEAAYRSLEQISCYDRNHSRGRCNPPVEE